MDNRWIEKILEAMIDGARELDSAPLDRDIKETINEFVDNKYQPICRKKALESFSKILFKVLNNIELDSDVYISRKRERLDPFENGILHRGLKTAEEYRPSHFPKRSESKERGKHEEQLLTVKDVALKYGITEQAVRVWINKGNNGKKLKAEKLGKSHYIKPIDLEEFKQN